MASNDSNVERFKVADDVAGVTLARQKRTIALSLQLDAARDIREQLKQCYRTHGMNHQDKCKPSLIIQELVQEFRKASNAYNKEVRKIGSF